MCYSRAITCVSTRACCTNVVASAVNPLIAAPTSLKNINGMLTVKPDVEKTRQ